MPSPDRGWGTRGSHWAADRSCKRGQQGLGWPCPLSRACLASAWVHHLVVPSHLFSEVSPKLVLRSIQVAEAGSACCHPRPLGVAFTSTGMAAVSVELGPSLQSIPGKGQAPAGMVVPPLVLPVHVCPVHLLFLAALVWVLCAALVYGFVWEGLRPPQALPESSAHRDLKHPLGGQPNAGLGVMV